MPNKIEIFLTVEVSSTSSFRSTRRISQQIWINFCLSGYDSIFLISEVILVKSMLKWPLSLNFSNSRTLMEFLISKKSTSI